MSKLTDIKSRISVLEGGAFQELCDALLSRKGYDCIHAYGMQAGTMKTTIGNPDTYFKSKNGKYVFVAYTTQKNRLFEKAKEDIEKCLDKDITGIDPKDIEEIIYCHTSSNLSAGEDKTLNEICISRNVLFDIYGIDRIADEIYRNYKILAKDFLGISIDTNQIQERRDFVENNDRKEMAAPLQTIFQFRHIEYDEILECIDSHKIVVLLGNAGVGKTRLGLEIADKYSFINGYKLLCIKSMHLLINEDLVMALEEPGKYMLFIDDANELLGLNGVLEYVNMQDKGYDVRIIMTLRDYVAKDVINTISSYNSYKKFTINRLSDSQIKEFLDVNMNIRNQEFVDAIIQIAEGNPRIAYMAGRLVKEKKSLNAISNAIELYEKYYKEYLEKTSLVLNREMCMTVGILSFLNSINILHLDKLNHLLNKLNVLNDDLKENIIQLSEREFVEIKKDRVAFVSDQCLQNYMLYYVFYEKKIILLSDIIEIGFKYFRNQTLKSIRIMWDLYGSKEFQQFISNQICIVWDKFEKSHDELFYDFVIHFCVLNH